MQHARKDYMHIQEHICPELYKKLLELSLPTEGMNAAKNLVEIYQLLSNIPQDKIPNEEPVFLLRAQDEFTPAVLVGYINLCNAWKMPPEFTTAVKIHLQKVRDWQSTVKMKKPDLAPNTA